MLFPDGRDTTAASQHNSGRHAVLALEQSGEVGLVGEAGALGDVGKGCVRVLEQATRALEAETEEIAMRRGTQRLLEGAGKMRGRETNFVGEKFHGETRIQLRIH